MLQVTGDETSFFHQILSLKRKKWKSSQAVPAFPVIFHRLSRQISPHIKVCGLLSKLISMSCFCHLQVIWWHFQKRQEVWTLSGTGETHSVGTTQRARTLYTRVLVGPNATVLKWSYCSSYSHGTFMKSATE